jgi:tetratricopeptide (TPR) repeat protein
LTETREYAPSPVTHAIRALCGLALGLADVLPGVLPRAAHAQDAVHTLEPQSVLRAPRRDVRPDASSRDAPPEAVAHYGRGRALYLEGRYTEALGELTAALEFDPDSPELHYNVARLHELLGEIDAAIAAYEAYRRYVPPEDGQELARTDATLKRLRGARSEVKPAAEPQIVTIVQPAPRRGVADGWFWALGGVGVATLVGAGATGGAALWLDDKHSRFVLGEDGSASEYAAEGSRLRRLALATDGLAIAGSTLTLSAILMYALRLRPVQPVISVGARGGDVWLGLRGRL